MRYPLATTILGILLVFALIPARVPAATKSNQPSYEQRRAEALSLEKNHDPKAEDLLKLLMAENPKDVAVLVAYGSCQFLRANALPEGRKKKNLLKECRQTFVRANGLKPGQPYVEMVLQAISEDGKVSQSKFSPSKVADRLIKEAEKAFSTHNFPRARELYLEALQADPQNYSATLFIGDTYFNEGNLAQAIEWFSQAASLNPDRETAFRYWADALAKLGRNDDALEHYIDAVIADPYNKVTRHMLSEFAQKQGHGVRYHAYPLPFAEVQIEGKEIKLGVDDGAGLLTMTYAILRAGVISELEKQEKQAKAAYRRSLAEEKKILELWLETFVEGKPNEGELDRELALYATAVKELAAIKEAGLLEAHILYTRADAAIAQDYASYRAAHREELRRYWKGYYLNVLPAPADPKN